MSPDEILQAVWEYCGTNTKETIESMNDLIVKITDNPKHLAYDLSERLEEWSLDRDSCPLCGDDIVLINRDYQSSEYFGQSVNEQLNTYGCKSSSCGYIKD